MNEGRTEHKIDRKLSAADAVMCLLNQCIVEKKELTQKATLSM